MTPEKAEPDSPEQADVPAEAYAEQAPEKPETEISAEDRAREALDNFSFTDEEITQIKSLINN